MKAQYVRSTNADVLQVVSQNWEGRLAAREKCFAWASAHGARDGAFYPGGFGGTVAIAALQLDEKPAGWVAGPRSRGYRPSKKSPEYSEMTALSWSPLAVPGLPDHFTAPNPAAGWGSSILMWPVAFPALNAAWVMLSNMPTEGDFGDEWVEVKASEAHAAKEALEA